MEEAIDLKGYATDPEFKWLYPPTHMPPRGQSLLLLNRGGCLCRGEWRWDGGFLAWQRMPKRDLVEEIAAIEYIENGERK